MSRSHCQIRAALAAAIVAGLGQVAVAQAEPGLIRPSAVNNAFPVPPAALQIYTDQLPTDAPGIFTCCVTVKASPSATPDVVIGTYDQIKGTFKATTEANALNTTGSEVALSLEPVRGRYAVFLGSASPSAPPTQPLFSARAKAGLPFPPAVTIAGGIPSTAIQITLGYVDGRLKLFYPRSDYQALLMQDLDVTNLKAPKLTGTAQVVAVPTSSNWLSGPATPITGPDGDVEGLLLTEWNKSPAARLVFQAGLDPKHPGSVVVADCGSGCSPSFAATAGGRILFRAQRASGAPRIEDVEVAWLLGDDVKPGGTADVVGAVSSSPTAFTVLLLSARDKTKVQLPRPFHVGHFALDASSMFVLGVLTHADASQRGRMSFAVPNDPRLSGLRAALQGLSFDSSRRPLAWTNTAWLTVR